MNTPFANRVIAAVLAVTLGFGTAAPASAGVISTAGAMQMQARQTDLDRIDVFFSRDDVRKALVERGVDPADALRRVGALTDAELARLAARIDSLPAGATGVVEVIGIVAVVLIVLELLGVTNVFTRI